MCVEKMSLKMVLINKIIKILSKIKNLGEDYKNKKWNL